MANLPHSHFCRRGSTPPGRARPRGPHHRRRHRPAGRVAARRPAGPRADRRHPHWRPGPGAPGRRRPGPHRPDGDAQPGRGVRVAGRVGVAAGAGLLARRHAPTAQPGHDSRQPRHRLPRQRHHHRAVGAGRPSDAAQRPPRAHLILRRLLPGRAPDCAGPRRDGDRRHLPGAGAQPARRLCQTGPATHARHRPGQRRRRAHL